MTTRTKEQVQRHVNRVIDAWTAHGRQVAAETLVIYDGASLAEAREAAQMLREQTNKTLHEPVIETANWLRCASGVSPDGTL